MMDLGDIIQRAPKRTLEDAARMAEQAINDYIAGTADENGVVDTFIDFTPMFQDVSKNTFLDPMFALTLLAQLCDRHGFIIPSGEGDGSS